MKLEKLTDSVEGRKSETADLRLSNRFLLAKRELGLNEMRFLLLGLSKGPSPNLIVTVTHKEFSECWGIPQSLCSDIFRKLSLRLAKTVISIDEKDRYVEIPLVEKNVGVKSYSGELKVYVNRHLSGLFTGFKPGNPYFISAMDQLRKFRTLPGINLYLFARSVCLQNPTMVCLSGSQFQSILGTKYGKMKELVRNLKPILRQSLETDMNMELLKSPRGYVRFKITSQDYASKISHEFGIEFYRARKLVSLVRSRKETPDRYLQESFDYCRDCIRRGKVSNVQDFVISTITDYRPTIDQVRNRKKAEDLKHIPSVLQMASNPSLPSDSDALQMAESIPADILRAILRGIVDDGACSIEARDVLKNKVPASGYSGFLMAEIMENYQSEENVKKEIE